MKKISYLCVMLMALMFTVACGPFFDWEYDNTNGKVKIKVTGFDVSVNGLTQDVIVINPDEVFVIDVKPVPEDADDPDYVISVDNEEIVTIDGNTIKANGTGKVTVTITSTLDPTIKKTITIIIPDGYSWVGDKSKAVDQSTAESRQR